MEKKRLLFGCVFISVVLSALAVSVEGAWQFCRLRHEGRWRNDWPRAEGNLMSMLDEYTHIDAAPVGRVVSAVEEDLSDCAMVYTVNVEDLEWDDAEARAVGDWLRRGGVIWTDGIWDKLWWDDWIRNLRKAVPTARIRELPDSHPIFNVPFRVRLRQPFGGWVKHFAAEDERGRMMVLMTYNEKDDGGGVVGDTWQGVALWSPGGELLSWGFSVNVILYIMSH